MTTKPIGPLKAGAHHHPEQGACIMELASYLTNDAWSDLPNCTNAMIGRFAQAAWDSQPEADMPRVARDFLPRLLRAKRTTNDAEVNKKLRRFCAERAVASAKSVQHLAKDKAKAAERIAAAEEWLATGKKPAAGYAAADAAADAAGAAYAAADAAAYAAAAGKPLGLAASRLKLLDELLDYHEKLLVDAGEYLWSPREWEDEALAFVDSLQ